MGAQPHRGSSKVPLQSRAEIARFREREEALEARARRQLAEEKVPLARDEHTLNRINIGHRRVALIERMALLAVGVTSSVLAVFGAIGAAAALLSGVVFFAVSMAAWWGRRS